ncbi:GxxExxY protein [Candidatus Falkowbacteria bacterium]|jgi:GxxExxY protein|nr:GxxExxY protein [Candidatus Falkowbacteria bacterium]MBT5503321.1 GxxExxY protein [Candidatus Falkowbacteria bacterium]MBT6573653.1 GxxExxY protein [Candidatus Falkowbacteria bacterium]MBT7348274.1 GxxExxY protein [Candidatus Falkowbacteria bacterium]MBT7500124.1 GxxExxY protein [Candidatus Falkowbacteria bacterium]
MAINNVNVDEKYVYSELSHDIIGAAYDVQNKIGVGHPEKTYQKALGAELFRRGRTYREQVTVTLKYENIVDIKRRFDFIVEEKVVVELKVGPHIGRSDFLQINEYLKMSKMQLGLIILFSSKGVKVRRVINIK